MRKIKDPYAEREKLKYGRPIASREYIINFLQESGKPLKRGELVRALGLETDEEKEALRRRLRAMERDGQLIFNRRGGYGLIGKMDLIRGRVIGHKDGFGFVVSDEGGPDLFLNGREMRAVFDGDKVLVRVTYKDNKGRKEAEIVEILERANEYLVGRYFTEGEVGFVTPENKRISQDVIIPKAQQKSAKHGQYVVVEITSQPSFRSQAIGKVVEILGDHMAPGMEIDVIIRSYDLPHLWSDEVSKEIKQFSDQIDKADILGRLDLRDKPFVTIDGEDAKDFDDAVYCEKRKRGGWTLYVAIADVSHYVKPGTALDEEAYQRGNSVYFPGRVIPMLPEILSNNLCSLKPNQDRLTLLAEMTISASGKLVRYQFREAVIHSQARLTYTQVNLIVVDGNVKLKQRYKGLVPHLENIHELYQVLHSIRKVRGALDFDTVESRVVFDKNRKVKEIIPLVRNDAHRMIEECMLVANVAAARFISKHRLPILYRVHDIPTQEKIRELHTFLAELGLSLGRSKTPKPIDYAELLKAIEGRPDEHLIQTVLLRSMSQAIYTPENKGHFGLAYDRYTHFTSPIRRYPDLLLHRAIRYILRNTRNAHLETFNYDKLQMEKCGQHCSLTERRADQASGDVLSWLKCEYMQSRVGQEFNGIITKVAAFGLFVELKDIFVEGLVHVTALTNDYYHYDPIRHRLIGERTKIKYRLADPIRVRVMRVDLDNREIDFELVKKK